MKKNQKGFSLTEGLLIVVILGLVTFVGWYVWQSSQKANTEAVNQQVQPQPETKVTKPDFANVKSSDCNEVFDASEQELMDSWEARLKATPEITAYETEKAPNITYKTFPGSVCQLSDKNTLVSFSHIKNSAKQDQTIDSKISYGLFLYSQSNEKLQASTDLNCASIPPSPANPPVIKSIESGVVTVVCPGYSGATYAYDLNTKIYTKK